MSDLINRQTVINAIANTCFRISADDWAELMKCIDSIKPVENTREWIPVSEGLPEQYKEVIVTDIETSDTYLSRYVGNEYWECDNGLFKNRIIAWQPKPKPYKADKEVSE